MNISTLFGTKVDQKQTFLEDGTRVPVSLISIHDNVITQVKTVEKDGYISIQLGAGFTTKAKSPVKGLAKKAGLEKTPRFLREVHVDDVAEMSAGTAVKPEEVFEVGDIVNVAGTSKGKGYAGVVKRYRFAGGPKTHGQSDRHRAPGSIGQSATPGRVYKGKRMAGRMGNERVTVRNLVVLDIVDGVLVVKGLIPGPKGTLIEVKKVGHDKKFVPLFKIVDEVEETVNDEQVAPVEEVAETTTETEDVVEVKAPIEETVVEENIAEDNKQAEEIADEATGVEKEKEEESSKK